MNIENNVSVPTELESAHYFSSLSPVKRVRAVAPRATALYSDSQADDGTNENVADSVAQIGNEVPVIIAFADNVSVENRAAIMLGASFAETVAASRHEVDVDPIGYLKEYTQALRYAGWVMASGGSEYSELNTGDKSLTMDSVIFDILKSIAGINSRAVIELMSLVLNTLQKDDSLTKLFESNSKTGSTATFRMVPCLQSPAGTPITYLVAMNIEYASNSGGALFWKWKVSNLSIKRLAKGVQFERGLFNNNEKLIKDHLGDDAENYFSSLKK